MKIAYYDYDIFPMVFKINEDTAFTIKPQGVHSRFPDSVLLKIQSLEAGSAEYEASSWNHTDYEIVPDPDGCLRFHYTAKTEGQLIVGIYNGDKRIVRLNLYALEADLASRLPLRGDLHMHTCYSDGREDPALVCANYRARGFDFTVITDHHRYYPSLLAMNAYKETSIPLCIMPGEEVHLPYTAVHIVNAGGTYSVNGLFRDRLNYTETEGQEDLRRLDSKTQAPPVLSEGQYEFELEEIERMLTDIPDNVDKRWYAVCCWAFDHIRKADGIAIFAHPYWIADMFHVPEAFTRYIMKKHPFDAFEVLGGELYYEQNGLQTALYYDEYREGRIHPVVGSSDTHGSTEHNKGVSPCSTIVFADDNDRASIVRAVKDGYSVAVDTISKEYRLVGEYRLQKYACFLMEYWYPIHDRLCAADGEMMRRYLQGEAPASLLTAFTGMAKALFKKYFASV